MTTPESPAVTRARLVEAMEWATYQGALFKADQLFQSHWQWEAESARIRHAIAVHDREQLEQHPYSATSEDGAFQAVIKNGRVVGYQWLYGVKKDAPFKVHHVVEQKPTRKSKRTTKRKT